MTSINHNKVIMVKLIYHPSSAATATEASTTERTTEEITTAEITTEAAETTTASGNKRHCLPISGLNNYCILNISKYI